MCNGDFSRKIARIRWPLIAIFAIFVILALSTLPASAYETGAESDLQAAVSVEVSILPCVRVGIDGLVRGNIPAVTLQHADLLTVLPL